MKNSLYYRLFLLLVFNVHLHMSMIEYNNHIQTKCPLMDTDADVIIAGVFPVHVEVAMVNCERGICGYQLVKEADNSSKCIKINKSGITWSEAMIETIREINRNTQLLPHIRIGYIICDSFNNIDRALDISLSLHSLRHVSKKVVNGTENNCSCNRNATRTIIGVVGGASSKISKSLNYIMNVDDIPQISYSSTSPALSDKFNFRTFLRTIPPDTYQGKALVDIIKYFNWSYISTVSSADDYGRLGIEALKESANDLSICFAFEGSFDTVLSLQSTKDQIASIVSSLKADDKSNVIILFCEWPGAQAILQEAAKQNLTGKTWIASEAWGSHSFALNIRDDVIGGMLGIIPTQGNIENFKNHVRNINPETHATNPWFNEYLQESLKCYRQITGTNVSNDNITLEYSFSKCAFVMDAVLALAHAIHKELGCVDGLGLFDSYCMRSSDDIHTNNLLHFLWNLTFTGALGVPITFDKKGDPTGNYDITNLQPPTDAGQKMKFVRIGHWNGGSRKLTLDNATNIIWNGGKKSVTASLCSKPCDPGFFGIAGRNKCCWKCSKCPSNQVKSTFGQAQCTLCPKGHISNYNKTACVRLQVEYLRWNDIYAIITLTVSLLGVCLVSATLILFIRLRETPIVKASNRELSYLLLAVLFLLFLTPLSFFGVPTKVTCILRPATTGILMTIASSILSVRAYRYLCIFQSKMLQKTKKMQGLLAQFASVFACALFPIGTTAIWYTFYPMDASKKVVFDNKNGGKPRVYRQCNSNSQYLCVTLSAYVVLLSLICCALAFRTRKLPEVFNDAKWLAMTMFTNNVLWFSSMALYLVRSNDRPLIMCSNVVLSGFVIWIFNFVPRLFVIIFHPERNEKEIVRKQIFTVTCHSVRNRPLGSRNSGTTGQINLDPTVFSDISAKDAPTGVKIDSDNCTKETTTKVDDST